MEGKWECLAIEGKCVEEECVCIEGVWYRGTLQNWYTCMYMHCMVFVLLLVSHCCTLCCVVGISIMAMADSDACMVQVP